MRSRFRYAFAATSVIAGLGVVTACSSDPGTEPTSSPTSTTSERSETPTAAPGSVAVSPGGVTTAVGAPADSTEDEYYKACTAAREWMAQQGGDPHDQIEPFLGMLQSSDSAGPATYGTPWSQLSAPRQAAVIVAVRAAADALCG
ncbi:lipoprotein LpqV [Mycolicibacterium pulveris]|uniref:LpqV protein n=1 Tax=Mycolicibacterium pulveris TaxID=36813 RepID=A0A7I7ULG9_MYCPV|nr:lipoprotein LpqV [Mycolicibacterium pulveris]MCV6981302.1 lipoprotein LpqV [Mycolicibacterium pulveris]BBY82252.1 LpqV protein [Mycolicibacterium pulveris]